MSAAPLYRAHPSMFRSSPLLFLVCVVTIPVGVGLIALLLWWVKTRTEVLTITDEEVQYRVGLFSKAVRELRRSSIRSVSIDQSLFDRIFGAAKVTIYSAGDEPEIVVHGLPDPARLRELL
ncbi:PH domain-containing protein [Afifella pfennigii]|uniref:PH domain-containing protein n=1 Tax=Afifella pfennigii TaxID=209897 RepID=UPI00047BAEDB|nr:PH domain-containing protein [Afifella pfennigii]